MEYLPAIGAVPRAGGYGQQYLPRGREDGPHRSGDCFGQALPVARGTRVRPDGGVKILQAGAGAARRALPWTATGFILGSSPRGRAERLGRGAAHV